MYQLVSVLLALSATQHVAGAATPGRGSRANPADWPAAIAKAQSLVDQMSAEEQNNITYGFTVKNGCSGNSGSALRHQFPGLCLTDGPAGIKSDLVTGFAGGVSVAASFNEDLAYERGLYMGMEFKAKGSHVANGPVVGPLGRLALDGRAWEGFGSDPYLAGRLAASNIQGMQQSVITAVKHFIGNEQETQRNPVGFTAATSANIDDVTMHELYLWPFQDAVHAGTGAVMSSYNRLNGTYASANDKAQNKLLKGELAFPGFIVSDWGGQHAGVESATGGLDMAMPDSTGKWANNILADAVKSGELAKERLADMAKRILSAWYHIISDDFPSGGSGLPSDLTAKHTLVNARNQSSKPSTRQSALEGHVLVKNTNNALPLAQPKILSLFGYDATVPKVDYPSNSILSFYGYGLQSYDVTVAQVIPFLLGLPTNQTPPQIASLGNLIGAGGSGATFSSIWIDPWTAIQRQAEEDDTALYWDFSGNSPASIAQNSDACLVFINAFATETVDRAGLYDKKSDDLVQGVAKRCPNTIVVMHNAWIRLVDVWIANPNVTAVIYAHLPGQYSGLALTDILYGRVSPSGRLPYTVAKKSTDYDPQTTFAEGTNIDYRWFQHNGLTPRYAFGYGLTYSTFAYSGLKTQWAQASPALTPPNPQTVIPGGIASLFAEVARVTATVANTGHVEAAEVPQLYVRFPDEAGSAVTHLRGFKKPVIKPGGSAQVEFSLTRRDLSRWNVATQRWELKKGTYEIFVGKDSFDKGALKGTLTLHNKTTFRLCRPGDEAALRVPHLAVVALGRLGKGAPEAGRVGGEVEQVVDVGGGAQVGGDGRGQVGDVGSVGGAGGHGGEPGCGGGGDVLGFGTELLRWWPVVSTGYRAGKAALPLTTSGTRICAAATLRSVAAPAREWKCMFA
ncbi:hypothetical protein FH972_024877 [Carpinus fangiana]|uniref:beta-glucosidase n=1 Tax=Carpinus fangiana TaxID=176857 RepID=A0A5N6KZN2_9ROSI|nr:hypothetical protein FH972_024877 [Carpinus fangiana]